jgi:hypothetical protein
MFSTLDSPVDGSTTTILLITCSATHKLRLLSNAIPKGSPLGLRGGYRLKVFRIGLKTETALSRNKEIAISDI